jgi:cytochrome c oxidase subunit 2
MIGWVYAMEPGDYERWLASVNNGESPRDVGEKLFSSMRCDTCHTGQPGARGPDLHGQFGHQVKLADGSTATFNDEYVRESLMLPNAKLTAGFQPLMPTYSGQLSEDQILDLIAYIKSLKESGQGAAKP